MYPLYRTYIFEKATLNENVLKILECSCLKNHVLIFLSPDMAALPVCTVCKRHKDWYDERDEQMRAAATESKGQEEDEDGELFIIPERKAKPDWSETSSRLAVSQVQIIFKLYEVLKREFLVGYICTDCLTLLEQVDSLQFQLHAVTKALKDRIDSHCGYKKRSDVIDAREGYRARFKALTAKKAALIDAEREDARLEQVADEDLPLINERAPMKRQIEEEEEDEEEEVGVVKPEEERNNGQMNSYEPTETYDSEMSNGKIVFNLNMSFWSNISDADYLHKVLAKQNFDHEFTIFAASRAQENLLYDGNLWKRDQNHKLKKTAKIVTAWFCSKRFLKTNAGRVSLNRIVYEGTSYNIVSFVVGFEARNGMLGTACYSS